MQYNCKHVAASLRPYQHDGFNWPAFLWQQGLGGVLADGMGLGKTLQAIALICHAKNGIGAPDRDEAARHPFLVVAPTSVVPNWAGEIGRFAPGLRVAAVTDRLRRSGTGCSRRRRTSLITTRSRWRRRGTRADWRSYDGGSGL